MKWKCECEYDNLHAVSQLSCPRCGALSCNSGGDGYDDEYEDDDDDDD